MTEESPGSCTRTRFQSDAVPAERGKRARFQSGTGEHRQAVAGEHRQVVAGEHRQAVAVSLAACRPSSVIDTSRILNFCTLPVTVIGNSLVNRTYLGTL